MHIGSRISSYICVQRCNLQRYTKHTENFTGSYILELICINHYYIICVMDRDSSVGITTRYELDGSGIEFRWRRDFPHTSKPALGPNQPPIQWVPGNSWGLSGRDVELTSHSHLAPKVKERVELYIKRPYGPLWAVKGRTLQYALLL